MRGKALDSYVDCGLYDLRPEKETSRWPHRVADLGLFKVLDVSAVRDPNMRTVNLAVTNRDLGRDVQAVVEIAGGSGDVHGVAYELNAPGVDCFNSFDAPEVVRWWSDQSTPARGITSTRFQPTR